MDYVYNYSDFPGGVFTAAISDRLNTLLGARITDNACTNIAADSDMQTVTLTFTDELSAGDKTLLDGDTTGPAGGLLAEATWCLGIFQGVTEIDEGDVIQLVANGIASAAIKLKILDGADQPIPGNNDAVAIDAADLLPITAIDGNLDNNGEFMFTVGPSMLRGRIPFVVTVGTLPVRNFSVSFK